MPVSIAYLSTTMIIRRPGAFPRLISSSLEHHLTLAIRIFPSPKHKQTPRNFDFRHTCKRRKILLNIWQLYFGRAFKKRRIIFIMSKQSHFLSGVTNVFPVSKWIFLPGSISVQNFQRFFLVIPCKCEHVNLVHWTLNTTVYAVLVNIRRVLFIGFLCEAY